MVYIARRCLRDPIGLAVLVQYRRVTDAQTNGRTHDDSIYRASKASRSNDGQRNLTLYNWCRLVKETRDQ